MPKTSLVWKADDVSTPLSAPRSRTSSITPHLDLMATLPTLSCAVRATVSKGSISDPRAPQGPLRAPAYRDWACAQATGGMEIEPAQSGGREILLIQSRGPAADAIGTKRPHMQVRQA